MAIGSQRRPLDGLSPRLGLGTLGFKPRQRDAAKAVLDEWVSLGGRLIDTAPVYGAGESERVLGEWLRSTGAGADILLLTKGGHPGPDLKSRLDPASISFDVAESLERLGTDAVDIYLLHRDDIRIPVGEMIDALNEHLSAGVLRSIGASNWTPSRVDEANAYAESRGLTGFTAVSNYFGLVSMMRPLWPGTLSSTDLASRAWHLRTGMPLIAWSAQSQGYFAEDFDPAGNGADAASTYDSPQNHERRRRAFELARARGCPAAHIALAWVLNQPIAPIALIGARTQERLRAAWAASAITLTPKELSWLEVGGPEA